MLLLSTVALAAEPCVEGPPTVTRKKDQLTVVVCPVGADSDPLWIGLTVERADGHRRDLVFAKVEPGHGDRPVTLTDTAGPEYERYVVAAWGRLDACAPTADPDEGCTRFKASLADLRWAWPEWEEWGDLPFAEVKPVRIQLLDAGAGAAAITDLAAHLVVVTSGRTSIAPGCPPGWPADQCPPVPVVLGGVAQKPRDHVEILYRRDRFRPLAESVRASLPADLHYVLTLWPDAPEDIVVAYGS